MNGFFTYPFDKFIAHVGEGGLPVGSQLGLHFLHHMADDILFIFVDFQGVDGGLVALHQLCRGKPRRDADGLGVVLNQMGQGMDGFMHRAAAEILPPGRNFLFCDVPCLVDQLVNSFVFAG